MKKPLSTLLVMIAAGSFFAIGIAQAAPQALSGATMDSISGERGISLPQDDVVPAGAESLLAYSERDTEVHREILRRSNVTDYPVESTDMVLEQYNTLQAGQASGKTFDDLIDEATPGRLPQFFIDEANRVVNP
ncbi:hypothetical protein DSLASN_17880 [Desulfoluna limicola]|uniref:DUF4168 domain-containing protein n=1 Tax=Desulfoluna limicola TaxID=2810562 RepID=A0ABM7PF38_9BACT|nr:hypothetical protein [Desulfoluna limicola]BCS96156.1 hypothetical protein DSLASN_17880 [Desulfoluna limicola]